MRKQGSRWLVGKIYPCPENNYLALHGKSMRIGESERHTSKLKNWVSWVSCQSKNATGGGRRQVGGLWTESQHQGCTSGVKLYPKRHWKVMHWIRVQCGEKTVIELNGRCSVEITCLLEDWMNFICFNFFFFSPWLYQPTNKQSCVDVSVQII